MATKAPTAAPPVISSASSSSPSIQSNVAPASTALNNNSSKISGAAATSIITAPLMSQSKSSNPTQVSNVPAAPTSGKPIVSSGISAGSSPSVATSTTVATSSNSSSYTTPVSAAAPKGTDNSGKGTVASSGVGEIKTTGSATITTSSGGGSATTSSTVPIPSTTASTTAPSPTKPTDLKTSIMNGGSTIVMKQPPPPVTILPPTPAATPPAVHRPLPQTQPSAQSATAPPVAASNQKPQSTNPPPSSSANNTSVKQSSATPAIQQDKEKIVNQEKPTQPLPLQHQGSSSSSSTGPAQKQGIQPSTQSGNQDQKVISNTTSSVTNPASSVTTSAGVSNNNNITTTTASSTTVSSTTPATVVGGTSNNNNNKNNNVNNVVNKVDSSVSQASPAITNTVTASSVNKSNLPTSIPSGIRKMEHPETTIETSKSSGLDQMKSANLGGGGDAQILANADVLNRKSGMDENKAKETENVKNGNNKFAGATDDKKNTIPPASTDKTGLNKADLILSNENSNDMNRSMYIPTSNEPAIIGKKEKVMNGGQKKEEIGEDVKRLMAAIEDAGLCGPKIDDSYDTKTVSASEVGKENKASKIARSNLINQSSRPSTTTGPKSKPGAVTSPSPTKSSPTKPRPASAAISSIKKDQHENGSPSMGADKIGRGKAAPASGLSNGSPGATLPPKSATSGARTSTSRVASAKGNTAPTSNSTKTPNQNKNSNTKANGVDSSSVSPVETETGTSSATGSRSTPRLRPSSSLYRPTASSALKGVSSSSAPHNTTSNHNLLSSPSTPRTSRSSTGVRASRSSITMGDSAGGSGDGKPATLREQFAAFARFGNKEEDGKHITLSNCDKWMKQAKVIDGKKVTTTDTSICFKKLFKTAKKITFEDFKKYVEELAKSKKMEPAEVLEKLANCGPPGLSSATKAAHSNVVDRLTDTSKYTGSHKERFDATGKGRGIEGRKDVPDGSGYVAAFKEKLDIKDSGEGKKEERNSASPTPAK